MATNKEFNIFEVVAFRKPVEKLVNGTTTKVPGELLTPIVAVIAPDIEQAKARFLAQHGSSIPKQAWDDEEVVLLARPFDGR